MPHRLRHRLVSWMLRKRSDLYLRIKGLSGGDLGLDREFLDFHARMLDDGRSLMSMEDRRNLWLAARAVRKLPGECAEVGVFKGGAPS